MFKHTPGMTTGTRYYSDAVSLKSAHTRDPEPEHVRPVRRDHEHAPNSPGNGGRWPVRQARREDLERWQSDLCGSPELG
ncbi:MAG: hypothetical protein ACYSWP_11600, partial [Planctomycetota bacterium]